MPDQAFTQGNNDGLLDRKGKVSWLDDPKIYDLLVPYLEAANAIAGWNFDWDFCERLQFTMYEPGDYYGWHTDGGSDRTYALKRYIYGVTNEPLREDGRLPAGYIHEENMVGKVRKISMTVNLTDPSAYEGGDFEFDDGICHAARAQGSVLLFPSFLNHRVTEVTSGTRYSIVMWTMGRPFR
jgi:PKHD-type hydroxylase